MTKPSHPANAPKSGDTERLVEEYLRRSVQSIPQTPEEVAAAEAWIANQSIEVPKRLLAADPCVVPALRPSARAIPFPQAVSDVGQGLARAARDGKTITPDVEERMKRDREQKEREAKGDK